MIVDRRRRVCTCEGRTERITLSKCDPTIQPVPRHFPGVGTSVTSSAHISGSAAFCHSPEQKLLPAILLTTSVCRLCFPAEVVQDTQRAVEAGRGSSGRDRVRAGLSGTGSAERTLLGPGLTCTSLFCICKAILTYECEKCVFYFVFFVG